MKMPLKVELKSTAMIVPPDTATPEQTGPMIGIWPTGTYMRLGNSGDLAHDVFLAIVHMDANVECKLTRDEIDRLIRAAKIGEGLRSEAGYGTGATVVLFHTITEKLATGKRVVCHLVLMPTPVGDAVTWQIGVPGGDDGVWTCMSEVRDQVFSLLQGAAGGPSSEQASFATGVPTAAELKEMGAW